MLGMSMFETMLILLAVVVAVAGLALLARRNPAVQAQLLNVLPNSGDKALLALEAHLYTRRDVLAHTQAAVDAVKAKILAEAKTTLENEGYTVTLKTT